MNHKPNRFTIAAATFACLAVTLYFAARAAVAEQEIRTRLSGPVGTTASAPLTGAVNVVLNGTAGGDRFDGVGAVSGGGATSVLLKDYPEKQRSAVLDLLFKPDFGASLSTLYVEVPGDGNSTQGTEPSHMHSRSDLNYYRGYEWWLMAQARHRNPSLYLDACAWSCPGWVGNGDFWSQDMCDYYVKWIEGLKSAHGLTLDALGCRNEKGVNEQFIEMLRQTLDQNGLASVKLHGFDNWGATKWDWCRDLLTDPKLASAVDVISNHTEMLNPAPPWVQQIAHKLHKPIWDTEEHVYESGFKAEIDLIHCFNENYIQSGVTQITNWYLVGSVYPAEPYAVQPAMLIANTPWSGHYHVRDMMWGYAHYGQFVKPGWIYLKGGCANLPRGGSYVSFKSPGTDYSIIAETGGATGPQTMHVQLGGGLSSGNLCVWRSDASAQFVRQADLHPVHGQVEITLEPNAVYSLSTTRGQQKGEFTSTPDAPFPFPYRDNFSQYPGARSWGYLPHYTADIVGVFQLAKRPDGHGLCLEQVLTRPAQSWAPEWMPYTVFGDSSWHNYQVSARVALRGPGDVGIMGRVGSTGDGWHDVPKGYAMTIDDTGRVALRVSTQKGRDLPGMLLASAKVAPPGTTWHTLTLQFVGTHITGLVDGAPAVSAVDTVSDHGLAGLLAGGPDGARNAAYFANLVVTNVGGAEPKPTSFAEIGRPLY